MLEEEIKDLTAAINALTAVLMNKNAEPKQRPAEAPAKPDPAPEVTPLPTAAPMPVEEEEVPVYKIEDLQRAMVPLCDQGKLTEVQDIIKRMGYASLMDVPPDKYGTVADGLRDLGAEI